MISRCALLGLRVRDSKALQDSAPGFNIMEEQYVSVFKGDDRWMYSTCALSKRF